MLSRRNKTIINRYINLQGGWREREMVVLSCVVEVFIPHASSLKDKRRVIKGLLERLRQRFNVSVAEISHHDLWQRSCLAMASVGTDNRYVEGILQKAVNFIEESGLVEVTHYYIDHYPAEEVV